MGSPLFLGKYRSETTRWAGYDYGSNGMYFVTICTAQRVHNLGVVDDNDLFWPSAQGQFIIDCWHEIPTRFPFIYLDEMQVMPNHMHGILGIDKPIGDQTDWQPNRFGPPQKTIGGVLRGFKAGVSKLAKQQGLAFGWQSLFHDRVIRNEDELNRIRAYIRANPANWPNDRNNPEGQYM